MATDNDRAALSVQLLHRNASGTLDVTVAPVRGAGRHKIKRPARPKACRPSLFHRVRRLLQLDDVLGGGALLALHDVELDPLTFGQALEALGLDGRMVDEAVLLAALGRD